MAPSHETQQAFSGSSRSPYLTISRDCFLSFAILAPMFFIYVDAISGDASIYFNFIKSFFDLPFSYQPETVSFGATSPLHVVLHAPIHAIFGENWLFVSKLLNFSLLAIGIVILNRGIDGSPSNLMLMLLLVCINDPLLTATASLYETGITFLMVALVYTLLKQRHHDLAILLSGSLYLVRPELLLITVAVHLYVATIQGNLKRTILLSMASFIPSGLYHAYMFAYIGELLPSSVVARALDAHEGDSNWLQRFTSRFSVLIPKYRDPLIYVAGFFTLAVIVAAGKVRMFKEELLMLTPILILFMVSPPVYLLRYLLPITPLLTVAASRLTTNLVHFRHLNLAIGTLIILTISTIFITSYNKPKDNLDLLMARDLASIFNPIIEPGETLIMYEVQSQYYLDAFVYSADAIVGNQVLDVLVGNETFEKFITDNDVDYLVTHNAFNYRKLYKDTLMETLYVHDLSSFVGEQLTIGSLNFTKILSNEVFSDPKNHIEMPRKWLNEGDSLRVYNKKFAGRFGRPPVWNSVYRITKL